eukprot:PhF_6_TR13280/c0_g1_i1/m.21046
MGSACVTLSSQHNVQERQQQQNNTATSHHPQGQKEDTNFDRAIFPPFLSDTKNDREHPETMSCDEYDDEDYFADSTSTSNCLSIATSSTKSVCSNNDFLNQSLDALPPVGTPTTTMTTEFCSRNAIVESLATA